jgi:glycosyltransferase involved in cell wall biosynthesis
VTRTGDAPDLGGTRVAVVNWRDPWHPEAGGAERYAWAMARGLTGHGATVCFVTACAPGQARREHRDGIEIVRTGGRFTVYPRVLGWLLAHRRSFHAVLDCQNGIPFFTPLVLPPSTPVLCVMHHVHSVQWAMHFPAWVARAGRLLEGPVARRVYRRHGCVAVSPSTVAAMRARLRWAGDIYVIPNGAGGTDVSQTAARRGAPQAGARRADVRREAAIGGFRGVAPPGQQSISWVGRLVAHKRPGLILPVAERLRGRGISIDVVGRGPALPSLAGQAAAAGLAGVVRLRGFLPEAEKTSLVAGSLLHLNTSLGEGWGLCVLEAAALGVPTVAFDVDGLRDAVRDGETGWLVRDGERIEDVAERAAKELADPARRAAVAAACRAWAARFSWDASAARMAGLVAAATAAGTSRGLEDPGPPWLK